MEDTFKVSVIDEEQHDVKITQESTEPLRTFGENSIPRSIVKFKRFYELQDKFKKVTNCKTHSSVM